MSERSIRTIKEKVLITGKIKLLTGLHIGTSGDFSPIGAVDSVVVRDPITQQPIIPGSSLKGKMRSLLAATETKEAWMPKIEEEPKSIQRLFGTGGKEIQRSRLQFFDLFMEEESVKKLNSVDTDLYLTEIKFENVIHRITSVANPRQMERVPAGAVFAFKLVYVLDNEDEFLDDMEMIATGIRLLHMDYIGMGGSRGNGRVRFSDFDMSAKLGKDVSVDFNKAREVLRSAEEL